MRVYNFFVFVQVITITLIPPKNLPSLKTFHLTFPLCLTYVYPTLMYTITSIKKNYSNCKCLVQSIGKYQACGLLITSITWKLLSLIPRKKLMQWYGQAINFHHYILISCFRKFNSNLFLIAIILSICCKFFGVGIKGKVWKVKFAQQY